MYRGSKQSRDPSGVAARERPNSGHELLPQRNAAPRLITLFALGTDGGSMGWTPHHFLMMPVGARGPMREGLAQASFTRPVSQVLRVVSPKCLDGAPEWTAGKRRGRGGRGRGRGIVRFGAEVVRVQGQSVQSLTSSSFHPKPSSPTRSVKLDPPSGLPGHPVSREADPRPRSRVHCVHPAPKWTTGGRSGLQGAVGHLPDQAGGAMPLMAPYSLSEHKHLLGVKLAYKASILIWQKEARVDSMVLQDEEGGAGGGRPYAAIAQPRPSHACASDGAANSNTFLIAALNTISIIT
ncbi:hypothetical protein K505DRAFT_334668 [Melanomma pulvis-pyrius CBS 109.77]|uniref:Uncharacterized protein n=1 Tax=Melanomma pulvis-pyrius CBS 109.77 TaxID=1314802 RepID=A0A6A6XKY1_9PLEO|nr:hypothetical protein K505DRAFT_334668 [Melanomma pulvis-pyrius CBS 109.77]